MESSVLESSRQTRGTDVFRFFIWDFDGTLIDTYPAFVGSLSAALEDFGCHEDPDELWVLAAQTLSVCVDVLCQRHRLEREALRAAFFTHYKTVPPTAQPPFPGAVALCHQIQEAGGRNVIFTHRKRETLEQLVEVHRMGNLFVEMLTVDDGYPRKPDPTAFLALMARHGASARETLALGDRTLDIEAGQNADVMTCLYGENDLDGLKPDYTVTSFAELEAILFPRQ
jgi:phosphoglycolate phosphatase-like HAD superfamily hydrolase